MGCFRFFILLLASATCCLAQEQEIRVQDSEMIQVGPGPEDMVLDTLGPSPRILVSCTGRREKDEGYGEIEAVDLLSGRREVLRREGDPASIRFRPHGIYLDGRLLYVISHENEPDYHPILVYEVKDEALHFRELIHTPFMHSPNALCTGEQGEIYLVNDAGKRGSMMEKILRRKKATVVRLQQDDAGMWVPRVVAEKLSYPAGINRMGHMLYAGDAIQHRVHCYQITGEGLEIAGSFEKIKGNDNIRIHQGQLLVPGHVKPMKFIGHAKKASRLSPVKVFLIDPESGKHRVVFENDGSLISGASTALMYDNQLYLSQIFEGFLLKVAL